MAPSKRKNTTKSSKVIRILTQTTAPFFFKGQNDGKIILGKRHPYVHDNKSRKSRAKSRKKSRAKPRKKSRAKRRKTRR